MTRARLNRIAGALLVSALIVVVAKQWPGKQQVPHGDDTHQVHRRVAGRQVSSSDAATRSERRNPAASSHSGPSAALGYDELVRKLHDVKAAGGPDSLIGTNIYRELRDSLDSLDPEQLMALADELVAMKNVRMLDMLNAGIMKNLIGSGMHPDRLRTWMAATEPALERARLMGMAGAIYQKLNPAGFREFANGFENEENRVWVLRGYYSWAAQADPEAAIREFVTLLPEKADYRVLSGIVGGVPSDANFRLIADQILPDSEPGAADVRATLLRRWAKFEPAQATDYAWSSPDASPAQLSVALESWQKSDPPKAMEWVVSMPPSPKKDEAVQVILRVFGGTDPMGSLGVADQIQDRDLREAMKLKIYQKWRLYEPEKADATWTTLYGGTP